MGKVKILIKKIKDDNVLKMLGSITKSMLKINAYFFLILLILFIKTISVKEILHLKTVIEPVYNISCFMLALSACVYVCYFTVIYTFNKRKINNKD